MEDYDNMLKEAIRQLKDNSVTVTDLVLCLRKKAFSILHPLTVTMNDEGFFNYVAGQVTQSVVARLFMFYPERFIPEMEVQYKNIRGRIDVFDKVDNVVIEIKLSRSQKQQIDSKPSKIHLEQIWSYIAIKGVAKGLLYYYSSNFQRLSRHEITMNLQEREEWLQELNSRNEVLWNAVQAQDPSLAPHVAYERDLNFLCRSCAYAQQCEQMRNAERLNRKV